MMQAIDRFDGSHGTRLATYVVWWIRQTLQIVVARQSHLDSLSPEHLEELGLAKQESEAVADGHLHAPGTEELASRTNSERQEALSFLMENLRPRERKVLDLRFGLTGNGTHSLRQIGQLLRVSKERVRQIQNRALEKLTAVAERVGWDLNLLLGKAPGVADGQNAGG